MSDLYQFTVHTFHWITLVVIAIVYGLRVRWLLKFKAGRDRQPPTGAADTTPRRGILYSWANVAMPWTMESTRMKFFSYLQFVIFHLGIALSMALSFLIGSSPQLLEIEAVQLLFQGFLGAAVLVGIFRLFRRIGNKYLRAISNPDDYVSVVLVTAWFFFALLSVPNNYKSGEGFIITFFIITAVFPLYVPFSKTWHYLYYPFTRYYLGKTLGHRGVYPVQRVSRLQSPGGKVSSQT